MVQIFVRRYTDHLNAAGFEFIRSIDESRRFHAARQTPRCPIVGDDYLSSLRDKIPMAAADFGKREICRAFPFTESAKYQTATKIQVRKRKVSLPLPQKSRASLKFAGEALFFWRQVCFPRWYFRLCFLCRL